SSHAIPTAVARAALPWAANGQAGLQAGAPVREPRGHGRRDSYGRRLVSIRPHRLIVCRRDRTFHLLSKCGPAGLHPRHAGRGLAGSPGPPLPERRPRGRRNRDRDGYVQRVAAKASEIPLISDARITFTALTSAVTVPGVLPTSTLSA